MKNPPFILQPILVLILCAVFFSVGKEYGDSHRARQDAPDYKRGILTTLNGIDGWCDTFEKAEIGAVVSQHAEFAKLTTTADDLDAYNRGFMAAVKVFRDTAKEAASSVNDVPVP